jgi:hypothetical protein
MCGIAGRSVRAPEDLGETTLGATATARRLRGPDDHRALRGRYLDLSGDLGDESRGLTSGSNTEKGCGAVDEGWISRGPALRLLAEHRPFEHHPARLRVVLRPELRVLQPARWSTPSPSGSAPASA